MLIHLKKWLLTVAIILASILGNPTVAVAVTVVGQSPLSINHLILNITNLTPQQEQQVQAVRQRRNQSSIKYIPAGKTCPLFALWL